MTYKDFDYIHINLNNYYILIHNYLAIFDINTIKLKPTLIINFFQQFVLHNPIEGNHNKYHVHLIDYHLLHLYIHKIH